MVGSGRLRGVALAAMALAIAGWGCGPDRPPVESSTTEAKVSETVTINGKLQTQGEVVFNPSNYLRKMEPPRTAPISEDGTYEITTLIGKNRVSVRGPNVSQAILYEVIAFEVAEGENTLNISLPVPNEP